MTCLEVLPGVFSFGLRLCVKCQSPKIDFTQRREDVQKTFREESAGYVPGFFAVAIIGENPEAFALPTPPLSSLANVAGVSGP